MFWYESDVREVERRLPNVKPSDPTPFIFYGSSSINYWDGDLSKDMGGLPIFNAAFGGSTLAACCWYLDRLIAPIASRGMVIYAGDNDIADGRHSEEVYISFAYLTQWWARYKPNQHLVMISIKPSPAREPLLNTIMHANLHIKRLCDSLEFCHYVNIFDDMLTLEGRPNREFYGHDGLHMNRRGFELWSLKLKSVLNNLTKH